MVNLTTGNPHSMKRCGIHNGLFFNPFNSNNILNMVVFLNRDVCVLCEAKFKAVLSNLTVIGRKRLGLLCLRILL